MVYKDKNSSKANFLNECEIRGNYLNEFIFLDRKKYKNKFKNSSSSFKFNGYDIKKENEKEKEMELELEKINNNFKNKKNKNRSTVNIFIENENCLKIYDDKFYFLKRLNYEIEINHPFLDKCLIRGSNILEAFDFYKKIQENYNDE